MQHHIPIQWTRHARIQAQRRCISTTDIEIVLARGLAYCAGSGAEAYFLGRRAGRLLACPDGASSIAVVVGDDQTVITVMHAPRPPQHWRRTR